MKTKLFLAVISLFFCGTFINAQIKIGDNPQNIDGSSVLELESTTRALVVTRITTTQMNAITPLQGALIYNTDTLCFHYYDGAQWINLCGSNSEETAEFTTNAVTNDTETIVITQENGNYNFEVGEITGNQIADGTINGFLDIQPGSISDLQLQDNAVGQGEIQDNAVGTDEIQNNSILPIDIAPGGINQILVTDSNGVAVQWVDRNILEGAVADISTISGSGVASDPLTLNSDILDDIQNANNHITNDGDLSDANELITEVELVNTDLIITEAGVSTTVSLASLNNAITDADADDALTDFNATTGYNINVDDTTIEIASDALQVKGESIETAQIKNNTIALEDLSNMGAITDGQILKWSHTNNQWEIGEDDDSSITDVDTDDALTDFNTTTGYNINVDDTTIEIASDALQVKDESIESAQIKNSSIALEDLSNMGATTDGQILKWDQVNTQWIISTDNDSTITDADTDDALTDFDNTTGYNINVDNTTIEIAADALQVKGESIESAQIKNNSIALEDLSNMGATTGGQILKWDQVNTQWIISTDDNSTITDTDTDDALTDFDNTTGYNINVDDTTIEITNDSLQVKDAGITSLQILDDTIIADDIATDAITTDKILDKNVTIAKIEASNTVGQILTTDGTDVVWSNPLTGTPNSIFFAAADGIPTEDNANLYWNPTLQSGAGSLGIGLDNTPHGNLAKVHIYENKENHLAYALQLQNYGDEYWNGVPGNATDDSVGILFTVEKGDNDRGKGGLVFQRTNNWARGDFHFLQNNNENGTTASLADKAFTITKEKNIKLYGNIIDQDDVEGNNAITGQVLTATATGTKWAVVSGTGNNLATDNLTQDAEDRTYDLNGQNLTFTGTGSRIAIGAITPQSKLDVDGQINARNGFASSEGSAGNPGFGFHTNGDTDTGMFRIAEDQLGFSAGGIEGVRVEEESNLTQTSISNSFATSIIPMNTDFTLDRSHHTVILNTGVTTINLPTPSTTENLGRLYILKNLTGGIINIGNFLDGIGTLSTTINIGVTQLQSDGTNWHQIN